jgi:hypothetical protein
MRPKGPEIAERVERIDIAWYDKRHSLDDATWNVYITRSIDRGSTFLPNLRVTDQSFATPFNSNLSEPWLGEYMGLEVVGNTAYLGFTSSLNDNRGNVFFDSVANASIVVPLPVAAWSGLILLGGLAGASCVRRRRVRRGREENHE